MSTEPINKWKLFSDFLGSRIKRPFKEHPDFIFYLMFLIVFVGAIDIWASWYVALRSKIPDYQHLRISIIGYAIVLICSGGMDLILSAEKYIGKLISILAVGFIILSIVVFFILFNNESTLSFFLSILLALFSIFIWWIANAENRNIIGEDYAVDMSNKAKELGNQLTDLENE